MLPAQANAAQSALAWLKTQQDGPITLSGDSAGAMLALWAACGADVAGALLIYGYFGLATKEGDEASGLGPRSVASMQNRLDPKGRFIGNPSLDPLAPGFTLPAVTVAIGAGADPLYGNSAALQGRHPTVQLVDAPGLSHGFLSAAQQSVAGLDALARAVRLLEHGQQARNLP